MQKAFAERDRARLTEMLLPTFDTLKKEYGVRQFQFHEPPATSFLRLHKVEKFGDDLSGFRQTVVEVNATQKPVVGLEKGVAGLGVRAVLPVFWQGAHVGSMEFGMTFGQAFFDSFKAEHGIQAALYLMDGKGGFETFASTLPEGWAYDAAALTAAANTPMLMGEPTLGDRHFAVQGGPITDYAGNVIGTAVVSMDQTSFVDSMNEAWLYSGLSALLAVLIGLGISYMFYRGVSRPLVDLSEVMKRLADNDTSVEVRYADKVDEVGDMAKAVKVFRDNAIEMKRLEAANAEQEAKAAAEKRAAMLDVLRGMVDIAIESNDAIVELGRMRQQLAEADSRVQSMASAVEELGASIREISNNSKTANSEADHAEHTAEEGVDKSHHAVETMTEIVGAVRRSATEVDKLAKASEEIGSIITEIEDIADKTNLLALNATIEAARAGDAGKGFQVVATEVKDLANQTGKATEDIRSRIDGLRSEMSVIVKAMQEGATVVEEGQTEVNDLGSQLDEIAHEINEVTVKMGEIASILSQQTAASNDISSGTQSVAQISAQNSSEVDTILAAMDKLNATLASKVGSFADLGDQAIVEIAKNDHVVFKKKVIDGVFKRADVKADGLPDHHLCRLGKWYESVTDPVVRNDPSYKALLGPHEAVHSSGKKALRLAADGDFDGAMKEVDVMTAASHEVIELLSALSHHLDERDKAANDPGQPAEADVA